MGWRVTVEPHGENPGIMDRAKSAVGVRDYENVGGMIVYVTDGSTKKEVSRVAWIRRVSRNPSTSFDEQFEKEVQKARKAVEVMNGLFESAEKRALA